MFKYINICVIYQSLEIILLFYPCLLRYHILNTVIQICKYAANAAAAASDTNCHQKMDDVAPVIVKLFTCLSSPP